MKRFKESTRVVTIILTLASSTLISLSCNQTTAPPPLAQADSHMLIKEAAETGRYFILNVNQKQITDTFTLPVDGLAPVISSDGQRLYIPSRDSLRIVDLLSQGVIYTLPYANSSGGSDDLMESQDGRYLAIIQKNPSIYSEVKGFYVLNTSDYSILYHDTVSIGAFGYSSDSKFLFLQNNVIDTLTGAFDYSVRVLELRATVTQSRSFPFDRVAIGGPYKITGSSDGSRIYLSTSGRSNMVVLDGITGAILAKQRIGSGGGFALSKSEDTIFYTLPGNWASPGSTGIHIFDIKAGTVTETIPTGGVIDGYPYGVFLSELLITPDGNWMIGYADSWILGASTILTFDLKTNKVFDILDLGSPNFQVRGVTTWPTSN